MMTLYINEAASAFAGEDDYTCEFTPYALSGAIATSYSGVHWTTSGLGTFSNSSVVNPIYTPSANDPEVVELTMTVYGVGVCSSVSDVMLLTRDYSPTAYAGSDALICETSSYYLLDATATNHDGVLWSTSGTGSFNDPTLVNATYTPSNGDILNGSVTLTLSAYSNGACPEALDSMSLTIQASAVAHAGGDATSCGGEPYILSGAHATGASSVLWTTSGTGTFDDPTLVNPTYTPGSGVSGDVVLTMTVNGFAPCGATSDQMILTVVADPSAYAGADASMCETSGSYQLSDATAEDYVSLLWRSSGNGAFSDATTLHPLYTPGSLDILNGNVTLTLTANTVGGCSPAEDAMVLYITPEATAYAGVDAEICEVDNYTVSTATASNYVSLSWSTDGLGTLVNEETLTPTYIPASGETGDVMLTLHVVAQGDCADVSDVAVLTITASPVAYAGADAEICEGDTYEIADVVAENYTHYTWGTNGSGTLMNANTLMPTYVPASGETGRVMIYFTVYGEGSCGAATDDMALTITSSPAVYAGMDAVTCATTPVVIQGAWAEHYASLVWSTDGQGTLSNTTTLSPTYTPAEGEDGSVTVTLTVLGNGACQENGSVSDEVVITVHAPVVADAGEDMTSCEYAFVYLDAQVEHAVSLLWTTGGDGMFDDNSVEDPVYTPGMGDLNRGYAVLTLHAEGSSPCSSVTDQLTVTFDRLPLIDAGSDGTVCAGDLFSLSAQADHYTALSWHTSGDGTFDDASSLNPLYTPGTLDISNGSVVLTLTGESNGVCANVSDEMLLTIVTSATAFAGEDASICEGDSYLITDANATHYSGLSWHTSGTGTFDDPTSLTPTYYPSETDLINGSVVLTLDVLPLGSCSGASDQMTLSFMPLPSVFAGIDPELCSTDVYAVVGAVASDYQSLQWSTLGDGTFDDSVILNPVYTPGTMDVSNGYVRIVLTAMGLNGCGNAADTVMLTIHHAPVLEMEPQVMIQQFTRADLSVEVTGGSGSYSYHWYPEAYVNYPTVSNPSTIPLEDDLTMHVVVTDNLTGCQSEDSVNIVIDPASVSVLEANNDYDTTIVNNPVTVDILVNDSLILGGHVDITLPCPPSNGEVVLNYDQTITYIPAPDFVGNDSLCYVICETTRVMPCDTAWVYITVLGGSIDDLEIFNGVTPNDDGYNDYFYIKGIENYPDNLLIIFNRWGDEVNRFENYNNTTVRWEGENKQDQSLPDGVYFYILEVRGFEPLQGWIFKQSTRRN